MKMPIASRFRSRSAASLATLFTGALLLTGCLTPSDRETNPGSANSPATLTREEGFRILESMGYSKSDIKTAGASFIVEGDMVFTSDALARVKDMPLAKIAQRAQVAVQVPKPNLLRVAIHSSMTDWAKFVHQAVNNWNTPNTRLHLEVVPFGSSDITIYSDASPSCPAEFRNLDEETGGIGYIAMVGFPGSAICINKDHSALNQPRMRVMTITHELGHTIGFRHTNTTEGSLVPGTPDTDVSSIMNSDGNWNGILSVDDVRALERLYNSDKPLGGTDLDGDRLDDIVYWRPSNGMWSYLRSSRGFTASASVAFGARGDMPLADTDIDGDGLDDKVVFSPIYFKIILSSTGALRQINHGFAGDIPIGNHDMDGDRKDDLVVWRWKDSTFQVLTSRTNFSTLLTYKWGDIGDIPVGGIDADRDGKDDFVVWRPTQRLFWVRFSASGFTTSSPYFMGGQAGDIPVGGMDLDRDSWDDLTVWRPATGNWYSLTSGSNFNSGTTQQWGMRGDVPLTGTDIDQDGKRDIVVWRPSDATWYIKRSNTNFNTWTGFVWGQ